MAEICPNACIMENPILISHLNDFAFCPISIYFHGLYSDMDKTTYNGIKQIEGLNAHMSIDTATYATSKNILQGISIYCEELCLIGKIDLFNISEGELVERKKHVSNVYDGYIFQLYGQCLALREMGYDVKKLKIHSLDDNRNYNISLPENDKKMFEKFKRLLYEMQEFDINSFVQTNYEKCKNCVYESYCDRMQITNG